MWALLLGDAVVPGKGESSAVGRGTASEEKPATNESWEDEEWEVGVVLAALNSWPWPFSWPNSLK